MLWYFDFHQGKTPGSVMSIVWLSDEVYHQVEYSSETNCFELLNQMGDMKKEEPTEKEEEEVYD